MIAAASDATKKLDRLGKAVLRHECARLSTHDLGVNDRGSQEATRGRRGGEGTDNLLVSSLLASEFHINKVDLELLFRLDTDQKWRTAASGDDFIWIVLRLEDKGEGTLELFEDGLDKLGKGDALVRLRVVNIFREYGDGLRIRLALKLVAAVLENESEGGGIGDDAIVDDDEVAGRIRSQRVAVYHRGRAVGGPARVCDRDLRVEHFRSVDFRAGDPLSKACDLANFLEVEHLAGRIAIDTDAGRIVTTVLLAGETIAKNVADFLAIFWLEIAAVTKDSTHDAQRKGWRGLARVS